MYVLTYLTHFHIIHIKRIRIICILQINYVVDDAKLSTYQLMVCVLVFICYFH